MADYPPNWPRCPACGEPALDGHITCGDFKCGSENDWRRRYYCVVCGKNPVDAMRGFDTCEQCLVRNG